MKKIFLLLILLFVFLSFVFANENEEDIIDDDTLVVQTDDYQDDFEDIFTGKKEPFFTKDRKVEIGLIGLNVGFGNNFITSSQFFKEKVSVNIDELEKGFKFNLGVSAAPFTFNFNKDGLWGFGIFTGATATGIIGLNGDLLTFKETEKVKESDLAGAAFAEAGGNAFFHVRKFKVKVKTALYYPAVYLQNNELSYIYQVRDSKDDNLETIMYLGADLRLYTAFPLNDEPFQITAKPGFDIGASVDFPLSEVLGLSNIIPLLDFDVGVDIVNLPIVPSSMYDYMQVKGSVGSEDPIDFFAEDTNMEDFYVFGLEENGNEKTRVLRPFKMLLRAEWRPFSIKYVSFVPAIGFAVNPIYNRSGSFEMGIKANVSLKNLFLASLGFGYHDRLWQNTLDLALNLRAFQWDLGVGLQAPTFTKSWSGGGFKVSTGFKFGW